MCVSAAHKPLAYESVLFTVHTGLQRHIRQDLSRICRQVTPQPELMNPEISFT